MEDIEKLKEIHAAYLCLKDSAADDLLSCSELKHVLHYAGFNPSTEFLEKVWTEKDNETISFNQLCVVAHKLQVVDEAEIKKIISNVFIVNGDSILVNDLKSLLLMSKRKNLISEFDIDSLLEEVKEKNGSIKVSILCKVISDTIKDIKHIIMEDFDEKAFDQRINKRTFTKKELATKMHGYGSTNTIDVNDWYSATLRGSLFIDEGLIISHQYTFEIEDMGTTVVKIAPLKFSSTVLNVDVLAYIFRETGGNKTYIGYTNQRNEDGSNYWIDTLKEGKYSIIPYTTGCIRKKSKDETNPLQILKNEEKIELTSECLHILEDIFYQMDLDGNGLLNRQEFNLYNWRTSGEIVQDDEWEVVQNNFDVENGEVTLKGFISLHQLEAEDNGGDAEELWLSLETIGYNRYGYQEKSSPFCLFVYSQVSNPVLQVSGLKSGGIVLDKAVIRSVMEETESVPICDKSDLVKFVLIKDDKASIVVQNKTSETVTIKIDCSESVNCFSNRESMIWEGEIERKSALVVHHLSVLDYQNQWSVICKETLVED